ncbi:MULTISPECIES: M50 family metallopeptidase [unclassified Arthrobacter]|uniref:M50 family metallopeptidase n=1 Tax=unclassified Arthrobacter TaxID=235627 RepID=UPI0024DFF0D5|nr:MULTISPECIES: M50 family metallopeptidase [unclassified Arthrobacter]MCC9145675.1 M50 family metallopeptidase [Arthrobacter sp. zg-Y919]MDK1276904.1 M50 family metallopeptidase [Arthrobacter sp. zg.Y919]WIB04165.1 M50 family metallopeptidase [Arthrobacter sp. zg-Y919]
MAEALDVAAEWWSRVLAGFGRVPAVDPDARVLLLITAVAALLSIPRGTWRWFGLFVTFVHELGHAFAALMTGQVVKGIRLRFDHSGDMRSLGRGGFPAAWAGFWGYPVPAVVGTVLVLAALGGWSGAALSASALVLLGALLFIRNGQGFVIAFGCAGISVLLVWFAAPPVAGYVAMCTGIALLVGAVRDWVNLLGVHTRRRRNLESSDAYILSRRTGVPAVVWLAGFALVIAASLATAVLAFLRG